MAVISSYCSNVPYLHLIENARRIGIDRFLFGKERGRRLAAFAKANQAADAGAQVVEE